MSALAIFAAAAAPATPPPPNGLTAEYFEDNGFSQHEVSRIDPTINASVVLPADIDTANGYSIRWSGYFTPPVGGPKLFTSEVTNNAVVEVIVDGVLVSKKAGPINQVAPEIITLNAGQPYPVQVTVRSTTPTTHRVVWRPLAISNWMEFQTSELTAAVDPIGPTEIGAVRTSSSTIGLRQSLGYHPNQSRMLGAAWSQGEVTNGSYLLWSAGRTAKEGAFPLNFLVNWSVLGPYYSETGISVRTQ